MKTMYQDTENQHDAIISSANLFESKQIRQSFIKKVYSLLLLNLLITLCIVAVFTLHQPTHDWAKANRWLHTTFFLISFVILIVITCAGELRRKHPHNLIALFSFTVAESLMLSAVTVLFDTKVVLMAGAMTAVICLALTLFSFQTKIDFTVFSGIMLIVLIVATLTMFIFFIYPSKLFVLIMSSIMAIICGIFLVIDTQMIIGGTHKVQISPEEYVFAALNLYLDIINMFLYILMIVSHDG
uniref:Protein lifeguard 1 n=1 Tax=Aceria tosichella TaxID=561515 RepID=A0A6G1S5G0_9ACAR